MDVLSHDASAVSKGSRQEERRSAGAKAFGRSKDARQEEMRSAGRKALGAASYPAGPP